MKKQLMLLMLGAFIGQGMQSYCAQAGQQADQLAQIIGLQVAQAGPQAGQVVQQPEQRISLVDLAQAHKEIPLASSKFSPLLGAISVLNGTISRELKHGSKGLAGAFFNQVGEEPIRYTIFKSNVALNLMPKLIGELVALHDSGELYEPGFIKGETFNNWRALNKSKSTGLTNAKFKENIEKLLELMKAEDREKVREILLAAAYFKISTEDDLTAFLSASGINQKYEETSENKQLITDYADTFLSLTVSEGDVSFLQAEEIAEMGGYCGEKALWSVFNMILYNPETKLLDIAILPVGVQKSCLPEFASFISTYPNPTIVGFYKLAYKDFLKLVHKISGVRYVRSIVEIPGERSETLKIINHLLGTKASSYQELAAILSTTERTITFNEPADKDYGLINVKINDGKNKSVVSGIWDFMKGHISFVFNKENEASIDMITKAAELDTTVGSPGTLVRLIPGWLHRSITWKQNLDNSAQSSVSDIEEILKNNKVTEVELNELSKGLAEKKSNLLHTAIEKNRTDLVKYFLDKGIDPNTADSNGETPLMLASNLDIFKALLDAGAKVNAVDSNGDTALHEACRSYNNKEKVKLLLSAQDIDVNAKNKAEKTPLMLAVEGDIIKALLDAGVKVNAVDSKGDTALHLACYYGNTERVELLLSAQDIDFNVQNNAGKTPLMLASEISIIKALLTAGAKVNAVDSNGDTALHRACDDGEREKVELLLSAQGIDFNVQNNAGKTPLMLAYNLDIFKDLLAAGAKVDAVNSKGNTALHEACSNRYSEEKVKLLLDIQGIDVNAKNNAEKTPLMLARGANSIKALLDAGAKVNAVDSNGDTALHEACRSYNNKEKVKLLLSAQDIDVNAKNKAEKTPLMLAVEGDIIKALLDAGVRVNDTDQLRISKIKNKNKTFFKKNALDDSDSDS